MGEYGAYISLELDGVAKTLANNPQTQAMMGLNQMLFGMTPGMMPGVMPGAINEFQPGFFNPG